MAAMDMQNRNYVAALSAIKDQIHLDFYTQPTDGTGSPARIQK